MLSVLHELGSTVLDGAAYTYDAAGNRISKTTLPASTTYDYSYDPIYELPQATLASTAKATEEYTYDTVGNRLYQPGVPYTYNSSNEMLTREGVPYTYDNNFNTFSQYGLPEANWLRSGDTNEITDWIQNGCLQ